MKVFIRIIVLLFLQFVSLSAGAICNFYNYTSGNSTTPIILNFNISNVIVQRDAPIGSIIATTSVSNGNYAACDSQPGHVYFKMDYNGANLTSQPGVYGTNVPGVGIMMAGYTQAGTFNYSVPPGVRGINGIGGYGVGSSTLKLVKVGNIAPGVLNQGMVGHTYGDDNVTGLQLILPAVTIVPVACSITNSNIVVPLDDVLASNFISVSTTVKPKQFNINLNCDAGARVNAVLTGTQNTDTSTAGVLQLTGAGSADVATGVGVQILYNNAPLALNNNMVLKTSTGGQEAFPFTAQYYQTKDSVTAGSANAIATLNLTYQ
jgi:type 1 fimbria pilin